MTYKKPDLKVFMSRIVNQLKELEHGVSFNVGPDSEPIWKNIKFFLIHGVFDKPARAHFLNMKLSTGFFGCLKCYQKGESVYSTHNRKLKTKIYYFTNHKLSIQ